MKSTPISAAEDPETAIPAAGLPDLTFKHLSPISIQVTDIQIASMTNHGIEPPNVGHRFPVPPESALMQWARDRLQLADQF